MKAEFLEYLKLIGITSEEYLKRIGMIMDVHLELCQDEIIDIFVDEYIKEDGTREYEDISFFSNKYEFSAIQFLIDNNFCLSKRKKNVVAIKIKHKDYDFNKATEKSRLNIELTKDIINVYGIFKASKENCDYLKQIYLKYIVPNIME